MAQPPPGAPTDRPNVAPPRTALSDACIVLVRTEGPVNLGMIARLCGNLGVEDLRLVAPRCDPDDGRCRAFATRHGVALLERAPRHADLDAAVADCALVVGTSGEFRTGRQGPPLPASEVPTLLADRGARRWALVFGAESDGLDERELAACQAWIHLDTFGHNRSYNLAAAVAIAGHLIAAAAAPQRTAAEPAATREEVAALERHCLESLRRAGYARARDPRFAQGLRRLLGRLPLAADDVRALRGMLRLMRDRGDGGR